MNECIQVKVLVKDWGELSGCRGDNLGRLLASNGVIPLPCGGRGLCGLCRVKILNGETNELTIYEKMHGIKKPWRLACQVKISSDLTIEIPLKPDIK
ncbi:MAG: 2Fe-2S iron-sulfur cluster binding domain-containing protein, partial [Staphylothermus sp.]|nr:2Fe-2S iron-sulfur cluster binding domain-containing protein [Staphylothermus sp.]